MRQKMTESETVKKRKTMDENLVDKLRKENQMLKAQIGFKDKEVLEQRQHVSQVERERQALLDELTEERTRMSELEYLAQHSQKAPKDRPQPSSPVSQPVKRRKLTHTVESSPKVLLPPAHLCVRLFRESSIV